ncbi:MAG: GTP 3',8-cyclase MoaA [Ignavibacteria bacterium]|nr:GTP 3',8-cyclase MoaA [Ignavibacteria bacterium]
MNELTDGFGRTHTYLRISVTDRCNLRCMYCMPAAGILAKPKADILTFQEIERVAELFARLGITKVRLTGGEPLVRRNLPELVRRLVRIAGIRTVAMTTNGVLLRSHIKDLRQAGLTKVNISLDTLLPERFERIAHRSHHGDVLAGIDAALEEGFAPLKINVVVIGGVNDDELPDFVELTRERPINVRFIEFMPFKANLWNAGTFVPYSKMRTSIEQRYELLPDELLQGAVARDFRIAGFAGSVSFITSMSDHFCEGCNRLRLTADGSIKSCLFYSAGVNLRAALRGGASDEVLHDMIRSAVILKPRQHPGMDEIAKLGNHSMIEIGG